MKPFIILDLLLIFYCCSQKKAVKPKHRQVMEGKLDGKDDKSADVIQKSDDRDSADNLSSESEKSCIDDTEAHTAATMEVPKTSADRKISITLTTSDSPSNTFITDLKITDPNMVRK